MVSAYWTGNRANLLLVLPFIALYLVQLAHHQLWQDEINAWAIAVASPTLGRLFHLIHYEAHPSLWYVLLWGASRFTTDPAAMKVVEGVIGSAVYLLLALRSPFPQWTKVLLYLSYFISFEYTVLSRMYGLLLLLTIIYADLRTTHPRRTFSIAAVFILMANTDTMGILLSSALAFEYLLYRVRHQNSPHGDVRRLAAFASLYTAGVCAAVITLRPAKDIESYNAGLIFMYARNLPHLVCAALNYFVLPWFPISPEYPGHFWEPVAFQHEKAYLSLLPLTVTALYLQFRKDRNLLLIVFLAALNLIAFEHLIYLGYMRHHGVAFLAFLVAFWMQRYSRGQVPLYASVLLGLSAAGGILAGIGQWSHPFSNAASIESYIHSHQLAGEPLVGSYRASTAAIAEMGKRPIYFLECNCIDTFAQYDNRSNGFHWSQAPDRLERAMRVLGTRRAIFLSNIPLGSDQTMKLREDGITVVNLAIFSKPEAPFEANTVYELFRPPASQPEK
jgi:hypothetical protein